MSLLEQRLQTVAHPGLDSEYYLSVLDLYNEDEWVSPNNTDNHFTVFDHLSQMHLVCQKREPVHSENGFRGYKVSFKYRHDLTY